MSCYRGKSLKEDFSTRYPKLPNLMISRNMFCKILYIYMLSRYDESNIVNSENRK